MNSMLVVAQADLPAGALAGATDVEPVGGGSSGLFELTGGEAGGMTIPGPVTAVVYSVRSTTDDRLVGWGVAACEDGRLDGVTLAVRESGVVARSVGCAY